MHARFGLVLVLITVVGCGDDEGHAGDAALDAREDAKRPDSDVDGDAADAGRDDAAGDAMTTDDGSTDDGSTDDGSTDDGSTDDGSTDDGSTDDGSTGDGSTGDGSTDDGSIDGGTEDSSTDASMDAGPPQECEDDDGCDATEFCRQSMDGPNLCHPYAVEGERCGGFVPAWAEERCSPELSCLDTSLLIADEPGICGIEVTIADLRADPEAYDGHVIGVTGIVVAEGLGCSEIACSPENPCCNTCDSVEGLNTTTIPSMPSIGLHDRGAMPYECHGDECDPYQMCEVDPGVEYRVIGTFHDADGDYIDVESIQPTEF